MSKQSHARTLSVNDIRPSTTDNARNTNLMKFINDQNTKIKITGRKCFPQQTFGISPESPDYFKVKNSLVANYGYNYTLDESPNSNKYQYYSQQHFITLGAAPSGIQSGQKNFTANFRKSSSANNLAFHRRKGKMTQFLDKNAWMGDDYNLIGKERSQSARVEMNEQHKLRIKKIKEQFSEKRKFSIGKQKKKKNPTHQEFMKNLLRQKLNLARKNEPFQNQAPQTKKIIEIKPKTIEFVDKRKQFEVNLPEWEKKEFQVQFIEWETEAKERNEQWQRLSLRSKLSMPSTQATFRSQSKIKV